jgi:hypothetical protein
VVTNIEIGKFECEGGAHAEGSARAEITLVGLWTDNALCSKQGPAPFTPGSTYWLIQRVNGQLQVNTVTGLSAYSYPNGGQSKFDQI